MFDCCHQLGTRSNSTVTVWLFFLLRKLDYPCGLKLISFSSYECMHLHGYSSLFQIEKPYGNWDWFIAAAAGSSWRLSLLLLSRLKSCLIYRAGGSTGFYRGWIFSQLQLWTDGFFALLCMEEIDSLFPRRSVAGRVPPLPALHLQVASWSDKLGQSRDCGSLNQHSLHAFSASSPFFLQRQRKRPRPPTCQEEMSHRQPLDFYLRLFCGFAPRPAAQAFMAAAETHPKAALCVIPFSKSCPLYFLCNRTRRLKP